MAIASKPASGRSVGVILLPPSTRMIDPTELTVRALASLGLDPNNIPSPLIYPLGLAVSLVKNTQGGLVLEPCELGHNDTNFVGFLALATSSESTRVNVLSIRGSEVPLLGDDGMVFTETEQLYLSDNVGRVTNVPTMLPNKQMIRVGFAITPSTFILNTDVRIGMV